MATFDIAPIFRAAAGLDRPTPAYDILKTGDDSYSLSLAVPGYRREELSIRTHGNSLTIAADRTVDPNANAYVYRGIVKDGFERTFRLAEHVHVVGARLENGLLEVELERRLPEALRPKRIEIREQGQAEAPAQVEAPAEPARLAEAREDRAA